MADTVDFQVDDTEWTEISASATGGFVTNAGGHEILYREAASKPATSVTTGHFLNPKDRFNFTLGAGQKVFARGLRAEEVGIVVTPD